VKSNSVIFLGLALVWGSVSGWCATATATDPQAPLKAEAPVPQLSPPVAGVVKMLDSGVAEEVALAYIQNAPTGFNLTPDDIIRLHQMGVSGSLTTAMLNHDKALRDSAPLNHPPSPASVAPGATPGPSANDSAVYNNLAPYGYWNDSPEYGPYWQPYSWLGYNYYPWTWLGFGFWWNFPGRGWCWFPHSHFHGFHNFHNFNSFHGSHSGLTFSPVTANRGSTFQTRARTFSQWTTPSTARISHTTATVGVRSSPWVSSFNGGFRGGTGGGFHATGSSFRTGGGGFRGGGGGGFHGGFRGGGRR
jgi:hypothetical protein